MIQLYVFNCSLAVWFVLTIWVTWFLCQRNKTQSSFSVFEKENNRVPLSISVNRANNEKCTLSVPWSLKPPAPYCRYVNNVRRLVFNKRYFNCALISQAKKNLKTKKHIVSIILELFTLYCASDTVDEVKASVVFRRKKKPEYFLQKIVHIFLLLYRCYLWCKRRFNYLFG